MDLETIFSIIDRAEKSSFNKFSIETGDVKISLERDYGAVGSFTGGARKRKGSRTRARQRRSRFRAHIRSFLCSERTRRRAVCQGRQQSQERRRSLHNRSHEDDERDKSAQKTVSSKAY